LFVQRPSSPIQEPSRSASPPADPDPDVDLTRLELASACPRSADGAPARTLDDNSRNNESSSALLMRLAQAARLFRSSDGRSYAEVPIDGHHEIHELGSSAF